MALVASSAFLLVPMGLGVVAVGVYLLLDAVVAAAILFWAARKAGMNVTSCSAGGAAMAYAWHAFITDSRAGDSRRFRQNWDLVFAVLAVILIAAGAKRTANFAARQLN